MWVCMCRTTTSSRLSNFFDRAMGTWCHVLRTGRWSSGLGAAGAPAQGSSPR